jgi:hypothetical protein
VQGLARRVNRGGLLRVQAVQLHQGILISRDGLGAS